MSTPEKLTSLTGVRFGPELTARLDAACAARGEKRPAFIRRATLLELDRHEAIRPILTPEQAKQLENLAKLAARGVDIDRMLVDALDARLATDATAPAAAPAPAAAA